MTRHDPGSREGGFTLIEVLVAMSLFAVLSTVVLGLAVGTSDVTTSTRQRADVAGEARVAMERITRELRQAAAVYAVRLPDQPAQGLTWARFWTDYNGDGSPTTGDADDPEVLTYCWSPAQDQLTLSTQEPSPTQTDCDEDSQPVLAAKVTSFAIEFDSSEWRYDTDGDGTTTWQELDERGPPVGNDDGVLDNLELLHVDLAVVTMTVQDGDGTQTYQTQIDMRNQNVGGGE